MKFSLDGALDSLETIKRDLDGLEDLDLSQLDASRTVLIHVDIIEGFVNFGALHSKDARGILPFVVDLNEKMKNSKKIFIIDRHPEAAVEFKAYPPHCIEGGGEDELVQEIFPYSQNSLVLGKNSTNLFHAKAFQKFLVDNPQIENFIFVGLVSDICILQATLSLRSYFNEYNMDKRLMVLVKGVDTFDLKETNHPRGLHNLFSLYNMKMNGIELYQGVF